MKVVAAGVFAGANGRIVLCGDLRLFRSELHGGIRTPNLARGTAFLEAGEFLTEIEGQLKGPSGGSSSTTASDGQRPPVTEEILISEGFL
jgi:hypothetical protein